MRSVLLLTVLAACDAAPAPVDAAPPPGTFPLAVSTLAPRAPFTLTATAVVPGAQVRFFASTTLGPGPCLGALCADLVAPVLLGVDVADGTGTASLTRTLPRAFAPGDLVHAQAFARAAGVGLAKSAVATGVVEGDCPTVDPADPYAGRFEGVGLPNGCRTDNDCVIGGCSGEVCAAVPAFTTCELLPYLPVGSCGCLNQTCQWVDTCP